MSPSNDPIKKPKISVIIPLYNHEKYIRETIDSVLSQTFQDFELIIINDGSSDRSETVVKEIHDKRIRYFTQKNQGAHHTINKGISLSAGKYIAILNSDDIYEPDRLHACLHILEKDMTLSAVFTHMEWINENGRHIRYMNGAEDNWTHHEAASSFKGENNIFLDLIAGNFLTTTSNLFCRKTVFDTMEPFRNFRYTHDYDFFLRLCLNMDVAIIEKPLLKYRIHPENTINQNKPETFFELGVIYADLILNNKVDKFIPCDEGLSGLVKFFNSISPWYSERIVVSILFYFIQYGKKDIIEELMENRQNPFRISAIDYLKERFAEFRLIQEVKTRQQEVDATLQERDRIIESLHMEIAALENCKKDYMERLRIYERSISLRVGRVVTYPVRMAIDYIKTVIGGKKNDNNCSEKKQDERCSRVSHSCECPNDKDRINESHIHENHELTEDLLTLCGEQVSHVFLVPWLVQGGSDLETLNYINALHDNNLAKNIVVIATQTAFSPWRKRLPEKVRFIDWAKRYGNLLPADQEKRLVNLLMALSPRVVHNINSELGFRVFINFGAMLRQKMNLYACAFCEDINEAGQYEGYSVWHIPNCFDHLRALLCDNKTHLEKLQKVHGLDAGTMMVNYHPAPISNKQKKCVFNHEKKHLDILWAGRLDRQKRPDILIKIALKSKDLPFHFHVYGAPVLEKDTVTQDFQSISNITYHGPFDSGLPSIDTACLDVFLYTSQWDGLPNVLLEAMASGLLVVSSDVGGIHELVHHGKTGFIVAPFDNDDLYIKCLKEIYNNRHDMNRIISNAYDLIHKRHSQDAFRKCLNAIPGYISGDGI